MIIGGVFMALGLIAGPSVQAAAPSVNLIGPAGDIRLADTIAVEVRIDSGGQAINAAEITVTYPTDRLSVERVGREQSALTLWPEEPSIDSTAGAVRLVGGRPGGFVAGPAIAATLYVRPKQVGPTTLAIDGRRTALYAHDGRGTKIDVASSDLTLIISESTADEIVLTSTTHARTDSWGRAGRINVRWPVVTDRQYSYRLSADPQAGPDDVAESTVGEVTYTDLPDGVYYFGLKERRPDERWSGLTVRRFLLDRTPPEPFLLSYLDGRATDGRPRLSWLAVDATSGVDRAELRVNGRSPRTIASPLLLESDWAGLTLTVTVFDQAGNSRAASWAYPAANGAARRLPAWSAVIPILFAIIMALALAAYRRRIR